MTHYELVRRAARWLATQGFSLILTEYKHGLGDEEPDAIGFRPSGASLLIECKATRADFRNDSRKDHRRADRMGMAIGMGQRRYFLCVPGVITPADLDEESGLDEWGLLYARPKQTRLVKAAPARSRYGEAAEKRLLINATRRAANYAYEPFYVAPQAPTEAQALQVLADDPATIVA